MSLRGDNGSVPALPVGIVSERSPMEGKTSGPKESGQRKTREEGGWGGGWRYRGSNHTPSAPAQAVSGCPGLQWRSARDRLAPGARKALPSWID